MRQLKERKAASSGPLREGARSPSKYGAAKRKKRGLPMVRLASTAHKRYRYRYL